MSAPERIRCTALEQPAHLMPSTSSNTVVTSAEADGVAAVADCRHGQAIKYTIHFREKKDKFCDAALCLPQRRQQVQIKLGAWFLHCARRSPVNPAAAADRHVKSASAAADRPAEAQRQGSVRPPRQSCGTRAKPRPSWAVACPAWLPFLRRLPRSFQSNCGARLVCVTSRPFHPAEPPNLITGR